MSASDFEAMLAAEFEASLPENSLYRCAYGASDWGPTNNFFDFVLGKLAAARPIVEAVDTAHNTGSPKLLNSLRRVLPLVKNGMSSMEINDVRGVIADAIDQLRAGA